MQKELPPPSAEQQALISDVRDNPRESRRAMAGPGTGKTTTLRMIAEATPQKGLYLAYNTSIKDEVKTVLPDRVKAYTAHGLAFGQMRMFEHQARLVKRIFPERIIEGLSFPLLQTGHTEMVAAGLVLEGLNKFYNSADPEITDAHFAGIGTRTTNLSPLIRAAREVWDRQQTDTASQLTHDSYLKMWQLSDRIGNAGAQYILFDEAQDASPVMIDVVTRMGLPITWVGDQDQSIYQWRGAVNAMETQDCRVLPLTQSWRFGQSIAEMANAVRYGKMPGSTPSFDLVGNPSLGTQIGYDPPPGKRAILTRTNAEWFAYAIQFPGRVHVIGGIEETARMLEAAHALCHTGQAPRNAPATISRFNSWGDLEHHAEELQDRELLFVMRIVSTYGTSLPTEIEKLRRRHVDHDTHAELILSTAHKSKGKEYDIVILGDGFAGPHEEKWHELTAAERVQEINLLFVAVSRAKKYLVPCTAAQVLLGAYRGQISRVTRENMSRVFGQPAPENLKSSISNVIDGFVQSLPERPRDLWRSAETAAGPGQEVQGQSSTANQRQNQAHNSSSVRHTAPPAPAGAPPIVPQERMGGNGQAPSPPPPPARGSGAFGAAAQGAQRQEQRPAPTQTEPARHSSPPSPAQQQATARQVATQPPSGDPNSWHPVPRADTVLLEKLYSGERFDTIAAALRVREEVVVARALRILNSDQTGRFAGGDSSTIHPENITRMNDLAGAINADIALDMVPAGVGPPRHEAGMELAGAT